MMSSPVAFLEGPREPGLADPGFKPEPRFQCRDGEYAFDREFWTDEAERHATPRRLASTWGSSTTGSMVVGRAAR
jgi:hypothetical protein